MLHFLNALPATLFALAGGKGGALARLAQAGYPVPAGFVLLPTAFEGETLTPAAWAATQAALRQLRANRNVAFAVRSSALSEDSAQASFAGEFETVLDVATDTDIEQAIRAVRQSRHAQRVQAYSQAQGLDTAHDLAVVVQVLVRAEFAGVVFTADPVSGSHAHMVGNFVRGLGDQLVSGEANPQTFRLQYPNGKYAGPPELQRYARSLFQLARRLATELDAPQDIEWAVADGKLFLLQSRPITTFRTHNHATGEWNDSYAGDYLWTNSNFGEALPDVMTPATWSLIQLFQAETFAMPIPGHHPMMGNIGGRFYLNLSLPASLFATLGIGRERMKYESEEFFGNLPDEVELPTIPFPRWEMIKRFVPFAFHAKRRVTRNRQRVPDAIAATPARCAAWQKQIRAATAPEALGALFPELETFYRDILRLLAAGTSGYENAARPLRHALRKLVGEADANMLLSGLSATDAPLASLGPVVGLAQVARGQMTREEFVTRYGHRGPHEFEISIPRAVEDPAWLDQQLASARTTDATALLAKQAAQRAAVWARFEAQHPKQARAMHQQLAQAAVAARLREGIRSEVVRMMWVWREFYLRAGALLTLGEGVFFLSLTELVAALRGKRAALAFIPVRQATHARYSALPPYPALIRGRFDPMQWANDPHRRSDAFNAYPVDSTLNRAPNSLRGFAGAAGLITGRVRVLHSVEEGDQLQPGEILVTVTTNVGWTPLFPRAAAIITDVGAPLSHAAIVARELGIPAVVGCGDATMKLKTGVWVRVNGGTGEVVIEDVPLSS